MCFMWQMSGKRLFSFKDQQIICICVQTHHKKETTNKQSSCTTVFGWIFWATPSNSTLFWFFWDMLMGVWLTLPEKKCKPKAANGKSEKGWKLRNWKDVSLERMYFPEIETALMLLFVIDHRENALAFYAFAGTNYMRRCFISWLVFLGFGLVVGFVDSGKMINCSFIF